VARTICGVDVSSRSLEARIGPDGPARCFPNTIEGIAELAAFCQAHRALKARWNFWRGYEPESIGLRCYEPTRLLTMNPLCW
jgi:transposase